MIPSDVVTAQVDCPPGPGGTREALPQLPSQYRLSNTLAGSWYHSFRGGVLCSSGGPGSASARGPFSLIAGPQTTSYKCVRSLRPSFGLQAASLALSRWGCAAAMEPCARAKFGIAMLNSNATESVPAK